MRIAASLLCLVLAARAAGEEAELVKIEIQKETELQEFLDLISQATGTPVLYDPNSQRIRGQKMGARIVTQVPKQKLFDTFRAILSFYELTMVPIGPKGYRVYLAIDSRSTNNFVKNKAVFVEERDLESYADRDGVYISTFIGVEHIENLTTLRTALSTMVSPAGIGRVHEVPGVGLVLMDFAPTVEAMHRIVKRMDVPSSKAQILEMIEIQHVPAKELAESVQELYIEMITTPAASRQRRAVRLPSPTPRVTWLKSRNTVLVRATRRQLESIRGLIAKLDQSKPRSDLLELVRLKHIDPNYLADLLTATLAGPATSDWLIRVVPDAHTNSVLINGDRKSVTGVKSIIAQLDVPKPE